MTSDPIKVVLTDYVWESLEPEEELFRSLGAEFIAIQCKSTEELVEVDMQERLMAAMPEEVITAPALSISRNPTSQLDAVREQTASDGT